VTVFQFQEGLSDRQAAEAVRGRIDWKYALSLELTDAGFDASVLSEFRSRLVAHGASERLLEVLVEQFRERGLISVRGKQRTDSTHVLGAVRLLNRLELVSETVRAALEDIATVAPEWLKSWVPPLWLERYGRRIEEGRLPKGEAARQQYAEQVEADGVRLLARVQEADAPEEVREVATVKELGIVWQQQYEQQEDTVRLRNKDDLPPNAERHDSPYDPEVRYSTPATTPRSLSLTGRLNRPPVPRAKPVSPGPSAPNSALVEPSSRCSLPPRPVASARYVPNGHMRRRCHGK
jgi:transposase